VVDILIQHGSGSVFATEGFFVTTKKQAHTAGHVGVRATRAWECTSIITVLISFTSASSAERNIEFAGPLSLAVSAGAYTQIREDACNSAKKGSFNNH
jgi:hypothetical protein